MKNIITILFLLLSTQMFSQDECFQVLSLSSRNYTNTETKSIMASSIYKSNCGASSSSSSFNLGLDSNETTKLLTSVYGISAGSSSSSMKQFCNNYESGMYGREDYSNSTNLVVEEAIRAWAQCQKLKNENVNFDINDGGHQITFSIKQNSGRAINLTGVHYNPECLDCKISKGRKTKTANEFSSERISEGKILNITCSRKKVATDSIIFYPNTDISINTDLGNLTIPIPEKATPKYIWLNEISKEIETIKSNSITTNETILNTIKQLETNTEKNYVGYDDILFGKLDPLVYTNVGPTNMLVIKYAELRNILSQSNGTKGILWRSLSGKTSEIFEKNATYNVHISTSNGYRFLGSYTNGKDHNKIKFRDIAKGSKYINLIAIKKN